MASAPSDSFTFTVGKLDAGMAILIGERAHLIEFPSLLLPPGVTSGAIVNISVHRNAEEEHRQKQEFWDLQEDIVKTFGRELPEAPKVEVRNVTQTSVTLEWPPLKLATSKLRSLDIFRNGQRLAAVPSPTTNTTSRLSGLQLETDYTLQLVLRTTAGTFPSNVIRVKTHSITDTSGISVCFGNVQDGVLLERAKMCLKEMGARWSERIQIDTTHFVCSTPAAIPTPGSSGSMGGPGVEYQRALQASIPVVQPQWIIACYSEKKMVPISSYYLGASPSAPISASTAPFARPASNVSMPSIASPPRRDSQRALPTATAVTALAPQPEESNAPDRAPSPSPETLARSNGQAEPEKGEVVDGRPRNGTLKKEFRFPPENSPDSAPKPAGEVASEPIPAPAPAVEPAQPEPITESIRQPAATFNEESEETESDLAIAEPVTPAPLPAQELTIKPSHSIPQLAISPPAEDAPHKQLGREEEEDIGDVEEVDLS